MAVLLVKVSLVMIAAAVPVLWLKMPPPSCAVLPVKVLVDTFNVPLLLIAPPDVPAVVGEELPENVLPVTVSVPWLKMPPPPCWPLLTRPLLIVTEFSVRLPEDATSKMRNVGVPVAVDRAMVAPAPWIVTLPVITGRPTPSLSVVLLTAVSVYRQPAVRVTVPFEALAVVISEMRAAVVQAVVAANAGDETATLPVMPPMSTAAPADRRRTHVTRGRPRVPRAPAPTLRMPRSSRLLLRARARSDHLRTICSSPIPHSVTNGA